MSNPIWSGKGSVPSIGQIVTVSMNGLGKSVVLGTFEEDGFLGVHVFPLDPPKWYRIQNKTDNIAGYHTCEAYGMEISWEEE